MLLKRVQQAVQSGPREIDATEQLRGRQFKVLRCECKQNLESATNRPDVFPSFLTHILVEPFSLLSTVSGAQTGGETRRALDAPAHVDAKFNAGMLTRSLTVRGDRYTIGHSACEAHGSMRGTRSRNVQHRNEVERLWSSGGAHPLRKVSQFISNRSLDRLPIEARNSQRVANARRLREPLPSAPVDSKSESSP